VALLYDGAGGLFTDLGKIIGVVFGAEGYSEDALDPGLLEIITAFDDSTMTNIEGLKGTFDSLKQALLDFRKGVSLNCDKRMLDPVRVINQLGLSTTTNINEVLEALHRQMLLDGKTIQKNTVTIAGLTAGYATPAAANVGTSVIYTTKKLDGYSQPGSYFPANMQYAGLDSEMSAKAETMSVVCTSDSQGGVSRTEGGEGFRIYGNPQNPPDATPTPYAGAGVEGSGSSVDDFILGPASGTLVSVPGFDVWTSDPTPNLTGGWTIEATHGVLGTHVLKETVNVYRGDAALQIAGDSALTDIVVYQTMPVGRLRPLRRYVVSCRVKADAAVASGTFGVEFNGTGYAVGGTEKISLATGAIPTVWTLKQFEIQLPAVIPADFRIVVKATGTLTAGRKIYVDDVFVQPVNYFGGVGVVMIPGSVRSVKGDRYTFTVANDRAGKFQSYWARYYKRQLPSSGAPNISELLALCVAMPVGTGGV
jgi:hypothetical protein